MKAEGFDTIIEDLGEQIAGPWRKPRQMLQAQAYGGHASIHDAATAQALGFRSGTIEGPTHFSQFAPLCAALWGSEWHRTGRISVHFREPAFEGDMLRAFVQKPEAGARQTRIWMVNDRDATILEGDVSVGAHPLPSLLDRRFESLKPPAERIILKDVHIGMKTARRPAIMSFGQVMGDLYPFTLEDKLAVITEPSLWHEPKSGPHSPWRRAPIPLEMASVLMKYTDEDPPFPMPPGVISLIADQEIRYLDGPIFVGEPYEIDQEIVGFSDSRRTESMWIRTDLFRTATGQRVATMLMNQATLKDRPAA